MKELTLDNLCRVCLKNSHFHKNIYEVHSLDECLVFQLLNDVCDLGISVDDGFPEFLCGECFGKVVEFKSFKANAHKGMSSFLLLKEKVEHRMIKKEELDVNCTSGDESEEPIEGYNSELIIKEEELDINCTYGGESEEPIEGYHSEMSFGPIILKEEMLTVYGHSNQQELIESDTFVCVGSNELPSTSKKDFTQQSIHAGSRSEFCEVDSLSGASCDDDMEPLRLELEEESIDSLEELQGNIIAPEKGVGRSKARFECDHCKKVFTAKHSLVRHMKTHGFGKPSNPEEEEGGKGTAPEKGIGGRKGRFECHRCKKVLMTKKSLKQHLAIHGIGICFNCDVCGRICVSKSSLLTHMRQHTGERPYRCTVCSTRFSHHGHLNVHMRIHTNVKPFKCKECDAIFNRSSSLKRHMRIHYNVKEYSCEVCHVNFRHKYNLTCHVRTHSGDRPYKCTLCFKAFSQGSNLRRHQVIHIGEKPYPCPHCSKRFSLREHLKRHLKNVCVGNCRERE